VIAVSRTAILGGLLVALALVLAASTIGFAHRPGNIRLRGAAEIPGPGDPDGSGRAGIRINEDEERVCFSLRWKSLDPVLFAHIHAGTEDVAGPVVVTLFTAGEGGLVTLSERPTDLRACTETFSPPEGMGVGELLQDIENNPDEYYVNVHSTIFPAGAIRGQLND
jgi:hypothetical protein